MSVVVVQGGRGCCICWKSDATLADSAILILYSLNMQDISNNSTDLFIPEASLLRMLLVKICPEKMLARSSSCSVQDAAA